MSVARRKTVVQPGSLGRHCKPSPVRSRGQNPGNAWLFCVLNSSKHRSLGSATRNVDESLHQKSTLLSVWGFEFRILNWYTGFKIALDTSLFSKCLFVRTISFHLMSYSTVISQFTKFTNLPSLPDEGLSGSWTFVR